MNETGAFLITLLLLWGAWSDIRYRILPNSASIAILTVAFASIVLGQGLSSLLPHAAHFAAALCAGLFLFAIRWIGAGDAKFYAALAAAVPLQTGLSLLIYVCFSMVLLVLFWFGLQRIRRASQADEKRRGDFAKVPLGVAITLGGICFLWRSEISSIYSTML